MKNLDMPYKSGNKMKKYRRGVFFVIYSKTKTGKREYLILKRKLHWKGWEFPKGGIEEKEDHLSTIKREIKEETGLILLKIKKFDIKGKFKYKQELYDRPGVVGQTFESLYAVEVKKKKIKMDGIEHSDYLWTDFKQAFSKLTWENQKKCLELVENWFDKMKFREYITKSGVCIWIGRDKKQNENLVNIFMGKKNIIMHTAASGSPFCIIDSLKPSKQDLKEASIACARYSQDWRNYKADVSVHVFSGKTIYKRENMALGTFGVKKYKTVNVKKGDILKFK